LGIGEDRLGFGVIGGDFADHFVVVDAEADAAGVADSDAEGAQDEFGAAEVDGVASEGVDDFHERSLDGLVVLDERYGVKAGVVGDLNAAHHALMEVAELLSAESRGAAADSSDLDVSTDLDAGMNRHVDILVRKYLIPFS
jgi:hypothetical protein